MKVLFLCTHNRCRSILCEAVFNAADDPRLLARSAGSQPAGRVHPLTLQALREAGYGTAGLVSQSWDELAHFEPDLVITVCDSAAGEACPVWMGGSLKLHWGLADPSALAGDSAAVAAAFAATITRISRLRDDMLALALDEMDRESLTAALHLLGFEE